MSRYCGPRLRIVRRLGELPGLTKKIAKIQSPPGQHGINKSKSKMSQYGARLAEKQRLRFNYGITEKTLLSYVKKAAKSRNSTGDVLLQLLEMRLDNILFRLGFTPSIASARQLINHKHVLVNNSPITIASYQCKPTDKISVITTQKSLINFNSTKNNSNILLRTNKSQPPHLTLETEPFTGKVLSIVDRQHVGIVLNERLIIEFYSRKV